MNQNEIIKLANQQLDEIMNLKKSYDAKMKKEADGYKEEEEDASDAQADALHHGDEHSVEADEESMESYTEQLSDEELYELISALSGEADKRGYGEDSSGENPEGAEMDKMDEEAAPPQEEMPMEEGEDDGMSSLSEKVSGLAEDELQMLIEACTKEMEARQSGGQEEMAEKNIPSAATADMMKSLRKSSDKQFSQLNANIEKLSKAVSGLVERVEGVEGHQKELNKSLKARKEREQETPANSYADPKVKVLEKSSQEEQEDVYMTSGKLQNWLLNEQRNGNDKVRSDYVTSAGLVKSEEAAQTFYRQMKDLGIEIPKKK